MKSYDKAAWHIDGGEDAAEVILRFKRLFEFLSEKKMLTEDDGYGQATYFFSEDVYEKNKDRIVQNKAINVSACKRIHQENPQNTLRVIHTIDIEKWAERILKGEKLDEILIKSMPAMLMNTHGGKMTPAERDRARAEGIRKILSGKDGK